MNAVIVLISILVSCNAGSDYKKGSKGIHFGSGGHGAGVGGVGFGGLGGGGVLGGAVGGLLGGGGLGGGGVGGGGLLGGGVYGPVGGGTVGGIFRSVKMNALIVLVSILVSCNAGDDYGSKGIHHYDDGGHGGVHGGVGGLGGGVGGLGGGVGGLGGGGGGLGGVGGVYGGGGGGALTRLPLVEKYGTCPSPSETDLQQLGPFCSHDEFCHGSQKCCYNSKRGGYVCQIPLQYQKSGNCNNFFMMPPSHPNRRACNDDTLCPGSGKCCKRFPFGQIDTCTFFSFFYAGFGGVGGSFGPVGGSFGPVGGSFGPVGGSLGPVGGSFGPVGGSGVVSPLLPVFPQGSKKKY